MEKSYDKIVKVPMITLTLTDDERSSWEKDAREAGEVEEDPDALIAAETDPTSGPSYDIRLLDTFLEENNITQRLSLLCLTATQMRLQSHFDASPVCIIRYRPTKRAADQLRTLMMSEEIITPLQDCNVHVALMGSEFDVQACGKQGQGFGTRPRNKGVPANNVFDKTHGCRGRHCRT